MAFALAIVGAYATDASIVNDARGTHPITSDCVIGNLQGPKRGKCTTTSNEVRCHVKILVEDNTELVPAFALRGTDCHEALYFDNF